MSRPPTRRITDVDGVLCGHDDRTGGLTTAVRSEATVTTNRVGVLDRSVEKTHIWLGDLAEELGSDDPQYAYRVLRAFLHALRDHLPIDEVASLAARLPIFIRGIFYEGWEPSGAPEHARSLDTFLTRIANEAGLAGLTEASIAATAANRVLRRHISAGEANSVLHELPRHLRGLLMPKAIVEGG
jgi:uncharacterized protein (DUF2267 family)